MIHTPSGGLMRCSITRGESSPRLDVHIDAVKGHKRSSTTETDTEVNSSDASDAPAPPSPRYR